MGVYELQKPHNFPGLCPRTLPQLPRWRYGLCATSVAPLCDLSHPSVAPSVPKYGSLRSPQLDMKWELPFLKLQVCLENCRFLGCKKNWSENCSLAKSAWWGYMNCKNLKIFRGPRPQTPAAAPSVALSCATSISPLCPKVTARLNWTWNGSYSF